MIVKKAAMAGTLESSDAQVTVEPNEKGLKLQIESSVINQYGCQIKALTEQMLQELSVENVTLKLIDKGALDCTLKARIECAIYRGAEASEKNISWGELK